MRKNCINVRRHIISIRINDDELARFRELVSGTENSASEVLREALHLFIGQWDAAQSAPLEH